MMLGRCKLKRIGKTFFAVPLSCVYYLCKLYNAILFYFISFFFQFPPGS
jgi:hypothetical protein